MPLLLYLGQRVSGRPQEALARAEDACGQRDLTGALLDGAQLVRAYGATVDIE